MKQLMTIIFLSLNGLLWASDFSVAEFEESLLYKQYERFMEMQIGNLSAEYPELVSIYLSSNDLEVDLMGDEKGNGGIGIVCRDENGVAHRAQLLDLTEGRNAHLLKYQENNNFYLMQALNVASAIFDKKTRSEYLGLLQQYFVASEYNSIDSLTRFVQFNSKIRITFSRTNDFTPLVSPVQKGCALENIAIFRSDNVIYINKEAFELLSEQDKAGLVAHEILYTLARRNGVTTSDQVRELVAYLFSTSRDHDRVGEIIAEQVQDVTLVEVREMKFLEHQRKIEYLVRIALASSDSRGVEKVSKEEWKNIGVREVRRQNNFNRIMHHYAAEVFDASDIQINTANPFDKSFGNKTIYDVYNWYLKNISFCE